MFTTPSGRASASALCREARWMANVVKTWRSFNLRPSTTEKGLPLKSVRLIFSKWNSQRHFVVKEPQSLQHLQAVGSNPYTSADFPDFGSPFIHFHLKACLVKGIGSRETSNACTYLRCLWVWISVAHYFSMGFGV